MKKIIISENQEQALQYIEHLGKVAKGINDLLLAYNELPALDKITTSVQVRSFLKNPQKYLDHAILTETGLSYGKKQPEPAKVAELYGIPYNEFLRIAVKTTTEGLEFLRIDEKKLSVEFDEARESEIYESFKEFARDQAEAEEVEKCRAMCELLNNWCNRYELHGLAAAAQFLGLKYEYKSDKNCHQFQEHISFIRTKLFYEQTHKQNE